MANEEHLAILKQEVKVWNRWREEHPKIRPDLRGADLSEADLSGADLRQADLRQADLSGAHLFWVDLSGAHLRGADLSGADLRQARLNGAHLSEAHLNGAHLGEAHLNGANLRGANLSEANLRGADLSEADLIRADLSGADLRQVHLNGANLSRADLGGAHLFEVDLRDVDLRGAGLVRADLIRGDLSRADLSGAYLLGTVFGNVDLSQVKGLETVEHHGPSTIGIDTIYRSGGKIPEVFLRGAGVPDEFITFMHDLVASQGGVIQFYSCFISYSSKNQDFANRLYADLQARNVRCWFAPEDLKIGDKFLDVIHAAIPVHDKLLVILSETSIASDWVEDEVGKGLEQERRQKRLVLFPITIDDAIWDSSKGWAENLRNVRHIGDFRQWKDHDAYQKALTRLLRDLKAEAAKKS